MTKKKSMVILGAGAWGTALAIQAHNAGNHVTLWAYLEEEKNEIAKYGENRSRLPGVPVPTDIKVTCDLASIKDADALLVVTPAQVIRGFLKTLKPHLSKTTPLIFCSKGIEVSTGALLSEICTEILPGAPIGFFSGPNFAKEIAFSAPGAATLALSTFKKSQEFSEALSTHTLRIYPCDDPMGVQIGGALKNVIAIASGMVSGSERGENAQAALVTQGLTEIARFGVLKGAKKETFMGLSGMGDLVLCCYSQTSRNMKYGFDLGQESLGKDVLDLSSQHPLTEGAHTVKAVHLLAQKYKIDMPICKAVYDILYEGKTIQESFDALLDRPLPQLYS